MTQKPLKRRAPLGSVTEAWRACAPKATFRALAVMDQLTCKCFFLVSVDPSRNTDKRVRQWSKFSVGAELVSALKALAWSWARATDCDLQSGSRKSISVCGLSVSLSLSFSPSLCLPVSLFFATLFFVAGHNVQRTQLQHPAQHQPWVSVFPSPGPVAFQTTSLSL